MLLCGTNKKASLWIIKYIMKLYKGEQKYMHRILSIRQKRTLYKIFNFFCIVRFYGTKKAIPYFI